MGGQFPETKNDPVFFVCSIRSKITPAKEKEKKNTKS